jgi:DNA helicase-2/ATP-dependent DNA helicase PcrA
VLATTAASYLETLNPEQRRAVEHGITADDNVGSPLLVIRRQPTLRR